MVQFGHLRKNDSDFCWCYGCPGENFKQFIWTFRLFVLSFWPSFAYFGYFFNKRFRLISVFLLFFFFFLPTKKKNVFRYCFFKHYFLPQNVLHIAKIISSNPSKVWYVFVDITSWQSSPCLTSKWITRAIKHDFTCVLYVSDTIQSDSLTLFATRCE